MRDVHPSHLLRAELLKSLKYAEISYRKYCGTRTMVKSQHGLTAVATFATMATLLLEIVGTRKAKMKDDRQQQLKIAA